MIARQPAGGHESPRGTPDGGASATTPPTASTASATRSTAPPARRATTHGDAGEGRHRDELEGTRPAAGPRHDTERRGRLPRHPRDPADRPAGGERDELCRGRAAPRPEHRGDEPERGRRHHGRLGEQVGHEPSDRHAAPDPGDQRRGGHLRGGAHGERVPGPRAARVRQAPLPGGRAAPSAARGAAGPPSPRPTSRTRSRARGTGRAAPGPRPPSRARRAAAAGDRRAGRRARRRSFPAARTTEGCGRARTTYAATPSATSSTWARPRRTPAARLVARTSSTTTATFPPLTAVRWARPESRIARSRSGGTALDVADHESGQQSCLVGRAVLHRGAQRGPHRAGRLLHGGWSGSHRRRLRDEHRRLPAQRLAGQRARAEPQGRARQEAGQVGGRDDTHREVGAPGRATGRLRPHERRVDLPAVVGAARARRASAARLRVRGEHHVGGQHRTRPGHPGDGVVEQRQHPPGGDPGGEDRDDQQTAGEVGPEPSAQRGRERRPRAPRHRPRPVRATTRRPPARALWPPT